MYAEANDARFCVVEKGEGSAVLFFHFGLGDWRVFEPQLDALADAHPERVTALVHIAAPVTGLPLIMSPEVEAAYAAAKTEEAERAVDMEVWAPLGGPRVSSTSSGCRRRAASYRGRRRARRSCSRTCACRRSS